MIALCDQRSFYVSCELIFRPDLRGQPVIVLSNNDGCVVALNEQAKACGMQKFAPFFQQKTVATAHKVNVFSSNYALYGEVSRRIMATLASQAPRIEVYSIDEAFLNLDGINQAKLQALGQTLKQTIWQQQRIPMGVSIASTKTLAKLGQFALKKIPQLNGVCILKNPEQIQWVAKRTPVEEVWGVGRRLALHLKSQGIHTVWHLMQTPLGLVKHIGHMPLVHTLKELHGKRCIPFEYSTPDRQNIVCSRSFGQKITQQETLLQAISEFAMRASEKLRKQRSVCRTVRVFIRTSAFKEGNYMGTQQVNFEVATADCRMIVKQAKQLAHALYKQGHEYAKAGVQLGGISPAKNLQHDFWLGDSHNAAQTMQALDAINHKFGRGTLKLAAQGFDTKHAMNQAKLSPHYLTCWRDIPKVEC